MSDIADIFVIGGGVNGCGIAADAAGRGLSVVLVEQNDLASGTSSASTKLIHGGLRYLEYYEFLLVRKALKEREVLLKSAPHIISPLRFLLPHHNGLRPAWLIRLGLFLYDYMGGRKILPPTANIDLNAGEYGGILKDQFVRAFEYSDCWVDDARLVILNAMRAREKGAIILPRHKCVKASRGANGWHIGIQDVISGEYKTVTAKVLINAAGPWVDQVIEDTLEQSGPKLMRLVKGSHIIVKRLYSHDRAYLFQGADGRIIFAIPYEDDFTLIGTTDEDYEGDLSDVTISETEVTYLCDMASVYFKNPINAEDVVASYAGVRPLYNDGASEAKEATRDFVLRLDKESGLLNIIGGKITTYRVLAEKVLSKLEHYFPEMGDKWTASTPLPGGEFKLGEYDYYQSKLLKDFPYLTEQNASRIFKAYGIRAFDMLENTNSVDDMGRDFGCGLYETEVKYLIASEWVMSVDDVLFRRSKLGLHMNKDQIDALKNWFSDNSM